MIFTIPTGQFPKMIILSTDCQKLKKILMLIFITQVDIFKEHFFI